VYIWARDARGCDLFVDAQVPRQVRQAERGGHPSGSPGRGRGAATRAFRLRDGQLLQVHVVHDALQFLGVQRLVPGQHHAVQLRIRRAERQHHVVAYRLPDVHHARELVVGG